MKIISNIASRLLGLIFLVFGINGLYTFIEVPDFHPFMEIMVDTHYIVVIKIMEIFGGLLLLIRRYSLLALMILGPIVLNILLYHLFIDNRNMLVGFINLLLYLLVFNSYKSHFLKFFKSKPSTDYE